jgi:hypothetical protein
VTTSLKHELWFNFGAERLRGWATAHGQTDRLREDGKPVYLCPLCECPISKEDFLAEALTAEDVPPTSVGGKKIVLTCQRCNNDQGSKIDSHLPKREHHVDLETGARTIPRKVGDIYYPTVEGYHIAGDLVVKGRIWISPGGFGFEYVPAWNNHTRHAEYLEASRDIPWRFRITPGYVIAMADLSRVRAAYLATFAVFGWSHILRPTYAYLRECFTRATAPDDVLAITEYSPAIRTTNNMMALVSEPGPMNGLVCCDMSRSRVYLPGPNDNRSTGEVAAAVAEWRADGYPPLNSRLIEWPTRPVHYCDPEPDEAPTPDPDVE